MGIHGSLSADGSESLLEGGLWSRRIIKTHARSLGLPMYKLSLDQAKASMASDVESTKSPESINSHTRKRMDTLRQQDPQLARGLEEMARFKIRKDDFFRGATITYFALRRVQESEDLRQTLQ